MPQTIGINLQGIAFSNSDYHKSREAITQHTIQQLQSSTDAATEEVIYLGDGAWDFKTCQNLGIRFIGIDVYEDGKLEAMGANPIFKDYTKPLEIMQAINSESLL